MTEHDGNPSADDTALASSALEDDAASPAAPATLAQDSQREARAREFIRQKQTADAVAAQSAAQAAALRGQMQAPGRPGDYASPEEYTRAVASHAVREVGADMMARQAAQAHEIAAKAAKQAWDETTADFRAKVPDFDTVAHNPDLPVTPVMADAIRESPRGGEIAYYLGKNPAEAAQIAALPPFSQAAAIARLEGRIGAGFAAVSRAPQPVGTLSGRGSSASTSLDDMDFEDYRRARGF